MLKTREVSDDITSLNSRCTKSLNHIMGLSNTTWGADRKVLLRLYIALIQSKLDMAVSCMVLQDKSYIKRLDANHNLGLCLGIFRTSQTHVQSLYVEAVLSLHYCVKLMSNEDYISPAYSAVFQSDIIATYEAKENAIKLLGLRIERHLDEVGIHPHVIAPYKVMNTPPWNLFVPAVCFDLCKYKKSDICEFRETNVLILQRKLHYRRMLLIV